MHFITRTCIAVVAILFFSFSSIASDSYVRGELLIQLSPGAQIDKVKRSFLKYQVQPVQPISPHMRIWLVRFDTLAINEHAIIRELYEHPLIDIAQVNHKISLRSTIPNDPNFASQWQHLNSGTSGGIADADIDSDEAWDITTGGNTSGGDEIVVCVIEGADLTHPDLAGNAWFNTAEIPGNSIDDDGNGYVDDYQGWNVSSNDDNVYSGSHGTQVAGMIGAKGNNNTGVSGANWNVKIMVVAGHSASTEASVIAAYSYPWFMRKKYNQTNGNSGAFVVATNASWGIDGGDPASAPLWCSFYDSLGEVGILNCGATANNSVDVDVVGDLPTACPSDFMVSVTATNNSDMRTFSAYGQTTIDVGAPGASIYTTSAGGGYGTTSGTSFASPLTAGVIGLLYSVPCPALSLLIDSDPRGAALAVRSALFAGVDIVGNLPGNTVTGGRINAFNSINILMNNFGCGGLPICSTPSGLNATSIGMSNATLNWNSSTMALYYQVEFREAGSSSWFSDTTSSLSYGISGLQSCTSYEFRITAFCDSLSSITSPSTSFNTGGCANCIGAPYCTSISNNASEEWISNVAVGSLSNPSSNLNGGYSDFTNLTINLTRGSSYPISVTPAFSASNFTEYFRVWIDFNQDGDFDDANELVFDPGVGGSAQVNGVISIPSNAAIGSCRMRVSMKWNAVPSSCESFSYGEVEDYCVMILDSESCDAPNSNYTTNVLYGSATLNWDLVLGAVGYTIRGRQVGTSAFVTLNISSGTTTTYNASGLASNTSYEWQVRANCDNSGSVVSPWTSFTSFTTLECATPANLSTSNINNSSARLNWNTVAGAIGYKIQGRVVGTSGLVSINVAGNSSSHYDAFGLSSNTSYEWRIQSNCPGAKSPYSAFNTFTTVGLQSTSKVSVTGNDAKIYPNPASGIVLIELSELFDLPASTISVFDGTGKEVYSARSNYPVHTLDVSEFSAGVYQVLIQNKDIQFRNRLVVY
ncbi:MAG: S8 family serine peptidase [Chitinophagales bacterium]|nr:S8 family serine peptidase [Chitinophagales bacterium]